MPRRTKSALASGIVSAVLAFIGILILLLLPVLSKPKRKQPDLVNAPAEGLPDAIIGNNDQGLPFGTNKTRVQIYTRLDVDSATLDGLPIDVTHPCAEALPRMRERLAERFGRLAGYLAIGALVQLLSTLAVTEAIRETDPHNRPVWMYDPNHRTSEPLVGTGRQASSHLRFGNHRPERHSAGRSTAVIRLPRRERRTWTAS